MVPISPAAIANPDSLAAMPELRGDDGGLPVAEGMWFVAIDVYQERTDGELPPEGALGSELIGSWWPYEQHDQQRRRRYPRLWARFHGETHPEPGGSDDRGTQTPRPPCHA
jgi:hypothetical protein